MTREEFKNWVDEPEDNVQDTVDTLFEYVRQLQKENEFIEQQNTALQARIKELEEYAKSERVAGYRQGADDVYLLLAPKQN